MVTVARAALCLCLWLIVSEIRGSYIPPNMNKTIHTLLQHYKISTRERFNGKPIFAKELLSGNAEMKMVFMGGVLETYEKLLDQMLRQQPTASPAPPAPVSDITAGSSAATSDAGGEDVRGKLDYILRKVRELKKVRYDEQEKLLHGLRTLRHIQVDNHTVQSKALWELPWLFEEASALADPARQQRRLKRQLKARNHRRG